ncbi:microneme associated antigen, putative [Plasmodium vinckei brucechwatti]|uniref:Microneme associated antigen, putative n=1 Tax=Plasmodium vinckei brucechwatti TaxID=119398 RepID=A0A6V7RY11_PLAVN|nr:microneme associated antigen, putative [Plasmodium vinckei brucechwatti]
MQEQFFKGKFSILNGGLFSNLCRINTNQPKGNDSEREPLKDERCLKNREIDEHAANITNYDNSEKMKKNFNSQLIYSYYNNFAANKLIEYEPEKKNTNNMYTHEKKRNNNEYNKNKKLCNTERNSNCRTQFNNNNNRINKSSNYEHFENSNENETLYFKEDNTIYNEFKKLKNDILALQIMNVNLQKQVLASHVINNSNTIPQHIIINNKTEVASNTLNQVQNSNNNNNKKNGLIYMLLKKILSSKINQMLIVSSFFISIYIAHKHWQRALKIAELQSKVNSNFILKSVKTIEELVGIRGR